MKRSIILVLFVMSLLLLAGCDEIEEYPGDDEPVAPPIATEPEPEPSEVPGPEPQVTNFQECVDAGNPVMESYPRQCRHGDETFTEEIEEPVEEPEPEVVEPFCGDGDCGPNEDCDSCYADCACKSPAECSKGECVTPECGSDNDCDDEDVCTKDKCYFAGHVNAYCGAEDIKTCRDGDGCCPRACTSEDDDDCNEDCGNDICEDQEQDDGTCPEDCGGQDSECGNYECENGENADNCPEDCDAECGNDICEEGETVYTCDLDCQAECGNGQCEPGEDFELCPDDCV